MARSSIDADDETEAARPAGCHAGDGVLDHNGGEGADAQAPGRREKRSGAGLLAMLGRRHHAVGDDLEARCQGRTPRAPHERCANIETDRHLRCAHLRADGRGRRREPGYG